VKHTLQRSFRLTCATALLAALSGLPAQAATFLIDLSLGGVDSTTTVYDVGGAPFTSLRVTGVIETTATGTVAASALDAWTFSFFRDTEISPVAIISKSDIGANAGSGNFHVVGSELFSDGFLLGVWQNISNTQKDTSIRFNPDNQRLVVNARDDIGTDKTFDRGFSFFENTSCDSLNLTQTGRLTCGPAGGQVLIGQRAAQPTPVPLPAAGWMLLAGLAGLGAAARRKQAA